VSWQCPRCGTRLVQRNGSHSCVAQTVDGFFADKPAGGVALARALIAAIEAIGPVLLHPVKTRIAFLVDVRFAAIYRVGTAAIRGHVWLREEHASARFEKIEKLGASDWLYHFEVSAEKPIDRELRRFLRLGYRNGVRAVTASGRRRSGSRPDRRTRTSAARSRRRGSP
jgi:hypothetical protein